MFKDGQFLSPVLSLTFLYGRELTHIYCNCLSGVLCRDVLLTVYHAVSASGSSFLRDGSQLWVSIYNMEIGKHCIEFTLSVWPFWFFPVLWKKSWGNYKHRFNLNVCHFNGWRNHDLAPWAIWMNILTAFENNYPLSIEVACGVDKWVQFWLTSLLFGFYLTC